MKTIRVACSPDSDDAFMFHALVTHKIDTEGLSFEVETHDTETLNALAGEEGVDVLAVSAARYATIADRYLLLPHGASVGRGYGPVVVARAQTELVALRERRIAVPGLRTTAYLVLRILLDRFEPVVVPIVPHDAVWHVLRSGEVDAALVIHEGRLAYPREGFALVCDVGAEWNRRFGVPLPLGVNVIRRSLGADTIRTISELCRRSIAWALAHRDEVMDAIKSGSPLERAELDRYLTMYANADTARMEDDVVTGLSHLFQQARARGLLEVTPRIDLAP